MAHARRPFVELAKLAKNPGKSHQAVAFFQKLYVIEKIARDEHYTAERRYALRQEKAKPILNKMHEWLNQSLAHAVPQSKLNDALLYMHQRWPELTHYLSDGSLEIDNNGAENQIRPLLWDVKLAFLCKPRGAQASALLYSLIATAVANAWNPFNYLLHLFENIRLCNTPADFCSLLPFNIISKNE